MRRRLLLTSGDKEAVDLGLSVLWASGNLTKDSSGNYSIAAPYSVGAYFSWANIDGYRVSGQTDNYEFTWAKYNRTQGSNLTKSFRSGDVEYDAASARLGGDWRIPTVNEANELLSECTWTWKTYIISATRSIKGYEVVGPNNKNIFLPARWHIPRWYIRINFQ